jgi:hypothetical protein
VAMAILLIFLRLPSPKGKLNEKMKRIDYFGKQKKKKKKK